MKIGILTYHFTNNIGSVLQAFALQKALSNLGYESEIINYQKEGWRKTEYAPYKRALMKIFGRMGFLIWPPFFLLIKYREHKFHIFRKKHLKINSTKIVKREELPILEEKYDRFIVGSDQIWNYKNIKFDNTYLLDFVDAPLKKNAYAASFGVDSLGESNKEDYRRLLSQFNYLSTREKQGSKIIYDLLAKECPVLLDPSLLLEEEEWEKIAVKPKISVDYVLLYLMEYSDSAVRFAERLAKADNCKVIQIVNYRKRSHDNYYVYNITPNEWLGWFANAKYIVTNSFHGTAFSINFKKDFYVEFLTSGTVDTNSRLANIIDMFSLQSRLIVNGQNPKMMENINYNEVLDKLENKREESKRYLETLVKNNE